ncbi:Alpha/beta hydrolase family-domain-containing protein [Aspergillus minisclerotigenes]|uniref:Alpha/beta hydrolase family-domain-containing protein n=1 Tax=Aspergillus minisclerotigenes TaxID=656917 RepID=A0A5N6J7C9_9EURO|nr:Alpha/beta hydrolase family-domain-containing protein [Aspergillus minisclerotigenes]
MNVLVWKNSSKRVPSLVTRNTALRATPFLRTMSQFRVIEHTVRAQHIRDRFGATEPGQANKLRLAVKQYIPKSNEKPSPGDVTIIGAHANGFPKEMYEPLWDDLEQRMSSLGRRIRSIWIADVAHQGQSSVLNERILGNDPSWNDHARDLLFLINQYQDEMPHPIIGVGHSMGGMHLASLALLHPSLLQALVLIDPVIQTENPSKDYAPASSYRRDIWPTKEDAIQRFQNNKVYQKWDPRVFEKYVEYGLREVPTEIYPEPSELGPQPVTLTTPKAQEVFTFLRPNYEGGRVDLDKGEWQTEMHPDDLEEDYPFYRPEPAQLFRRLGEMIPSVLYVFGETSELSSPAARQAKLDVTGTGVGGNGGFRRQRVKEVTLPTGHLVPMERVMDCANAIATFSDAELSRWDAERQKYLRRWNAIPRRDKITVDDKWKQHIGTLSRKPKL